MSHNIEIRNNRASFVSVKEPAWHRLGKVVENALTSKEAIEYANMDYKVKFSPVIARTGIDEKELRDSKNNIFSLNYDTNRIFKDKYITDAIDYNKKMNNIYFGSAKQTMIKAQTLINDLVI